MFGGQAAPPCRTLLIHPDGSEEEIPSKKVLTIRAGDVMRVWTSGGGGYGDPLARPVETVHEDVADGRVTRAGAARDYGVVVLADGSLDVAATQTLRQRLRSERGDGPLPVVTRGGALLETQ